MKKIILKLLPRRTFILLLRLKYKKNFTQIHNENITQNKIISVTIHNKEVKTKLNSMLKKMCIGISKKQSVYFTPIAVIDASKGYDHYLQTLNSNARSKVKRAAKKGISCQPFIWNEYLDDLYEVNKSSQTRQGRAMDEEYLKPPKSIQIDDKDSFIIRHIGAFYESKLVGYIELYIYNNFCMTNRLLGHKNFQNKYVMNALFAYSIEFSINNKIDFINYLTMINKETNSLSGFKNRLGFREYSLRVIE